MASGQTTHYGLNQWQPEDAVLRTDFNADNAKTDTALNNLEQLIGTKEAALLASISQCYGPKNPALVTGSYVGSCLGTSTQVPITIQLGFRPSLLLILDGTQENDDDYALLVEVPQAYMILRRDGQGRYLEGLTFSDSGFTVNIYNGTDYNFNVHGHTYYYFALR